MAGEIPCHERLWVSRHNVHVLVHILLNLKVQIFKGERLPSDDDYIKVF